VDTFPKGRVNQITRSNQMQIIKTTGFLATPQKGSGPAVMVLPAWWGLNNFFKNLCRRFAKNGYVAWAPDYHGGRYASTVEEAYQFKAKLNQKTVFENLLKVVEEMQHSEIVTGKTISVVGFSMGARFALELSASKPNDISEVVIFYGTSIVDYSKAKAAYQGHFAEQDEFFAASGVKKLEKYLQRNGREVSFYTYEGTKHWFFESSCKTRYLPSKANLAWKRTLEFLKAHQIQK
jgi:carboxymethylenebutenolidase